MTIRFHIGRFARTLAALLAVSVPVPAAAADMPTITVGLTRGASGAHLPAYIAMEKGFFQREGLKARFVTLSSKALVSAGLAGTVDFVPESSAGAQAALRGAKLVFVVGQSLVSQWAIVTPTTVGSVKDLKGQTLGYGRPGTAGYDEGVMILSRFFGMAPGRDYKIISYRTEPDRLAALINGQIKGALMSYPHAAKAQLRGYEILIKAGQYLPRVGGAIWVRRAFLDGNRPVVEKFIRAIAKSIQFLRTNRKASVPVIQKYFGFQKVAEGQFIWDMLHDQYGPDIPVVLLNKLFDDRRQRLVEAHMWPDGKKLPNPESFVARDLLGKVLRSMGYYLQAPTAPGIITPGKQSG